MSQAYGSMQACQRGLEEQGKPLTGPNDGSIWCNSTWDSVLCWPATPGDGSSSQPCPPLKGLDPTKSLTKFCHETGRWMGKTETDFLPERPWGHTDYMICMNTDGGTIVKAQDIAKSARLLAYILLGISFFALLLGIVLFIVFSCRRKRSCVYHQPYLHLMTVSLGFFQVFYFLLEYFKASLIAWFVAECIYLLVKTFWDNVRHQNVLILILLVVGYVLPILNLGCWLIIILTQGQLERCLGSYYLQKEFYIVVIPQYIGLVLSLVMVIFATVVQCVKRGGRRKEKNYWILRSLVAFILFVVLLVPLILGRIPFTPTKDNIKLFEVYTYVATVFYMFQGAVVAVLSILVMIVFIKIPVVTNVADREAMQKLM